VRLIPKKMKKCDENLLRLLRKIAEGTRSFGRSNRL
jgi:hypothetical protein